LRPHVFLSRPIRLEACSRKTYAAARLAPGACPQLGRRSLPLQRAGPVPRGSNSVSNHTTPPRLRAKPDGGDRKSNPKNGGLISASMAPHGRGPPTPYGTTVPQCPDCLEPLNGVKLTPFPFTGLWLLERARASERVLPEVFGNLRQESGALEERRIRCVVAVRLVNEVF
jgi:hypothetical protein